jgi:hypothetical protein
LETEVDIDAYPDTWPKITIVGKRKCCARDKRETEHEQTSANIGNSSERASNLFSLHHSAPCPFLVGLTVQGAYPVKVVSDLICTARQDNREKTKELQIQ